MQEGWICPKCGRVNNPNLDHCPCINTGTSPVIYPQPYIYPYYPYYPYYPPIVTYSDSTNKGE